MFNKKMNPAGETQPQPSPSAQTPETSESPAPDAQQPQAQSSGNAPQSGGTGASTVLAEGSRFTGTANVAGTFRVEGNAEGDIDAAESFVVGKTGEVKAKVATRRAVLNGQFQGKIEASDRVELQSGSRVQADIKARNMVMEDGVQFRGGCQIGG